MPPDSAPGNKSRVATAPRTTRRLFFALWPPEEIAAQLFDAASQLAKGCGGRAMRRDSLHLTLHFLGDVAESELPWICRAAETVRAQEFSFVLDTLGYWRHNRIVWAGCSEPVPPLAELAVALIVALRDGGQPDGRSTFTPHLTLLRKAAQPSLLEMAKPLPWAVREFVLVESVVTGIGPRYVILGRWPLY